MGLSGKIPVKTRAPWTPFSLFPGSFFCTISFLILSGKTGNSVHSVQKPDLFPGTPGTWDSSIRDLFSVQFSRKTLLKLGYICPECPEIYHGMKVTGSGNMLYSTFSLNSESHTHVLLADWWVGIIPSRLKKGLCSLITKKKFLVQHNTIFF